MSTTLVLGFFDGVHLGHQAVINAAVSFNNKNHIIMLSLKDSPEEFFTGKAQYILSRENSVSKMKSFGINEVVLQDFSEIHSTHPEDYISQIVEKYRPDTVVTGFNYTFGVNKSGNPDNLRSSKEFKYICTNPYKKDGEIVSSSLIKRCLRIGDIKRANQFLGSKFILEGTVKSGMQLGRTIGFPTANFDYPSKIVEIPFGVYAVKTDTNIGIMNYGIKPTIEGKRKPLIEVHLIDYHGDLYSKYLKIELIDKIRDEVRFENLEELKEQIQKDKEACLELLL